MDNTFNEIAKLVPIYSEDLLSIIKPIKDNATDIHFSIGFSPTIFMANERYVLKNCKKLNQNDMQNLIFELCDNSVYKHSEEIKNGYINVKNLYRASLCGTAVVKDKQIENISNITSVSIRVPRYVYGCSEELFQVINNVDRGLLIIGEPSSGKTTLLRDLIISLSEKRLVVLDERFELTTKNSAYDLDVLYAYPKKDGINHAIRNLGARYVICDEISFEELEVLENATSSGVSIIASVHGKLETGLRPLVKKLLESGAFSKVVQLYGREKPCQIKKIWSENELLKNFRMHNDFSSNITVRAI